MTVSPTGFLPGDPSGVRVTDLARIIAQGSLAQMLPNLSTVAARANMPVSELVGLIMALGEQAPARTEWTQLLRDGRCFDFKFDIPASVGNFSVAALYNPANSTQRVLVHRIRVGSTTAGGMRARFIAAGDPAYGSVNATTVPMTGFRPQTLNFPFTPGAPPPTTSAVHETGNPAAVVGSATNDLDIATVAASTVNELLTSAGSDFSFELPPDAGIVVFHNTANVVLQGSIQYALVPDDGTYP